MVSWFESFFLAFIPLFVAIDVFGVLPFFVGLTEKVSLDSKKRLITQATWTVLGISLLFLFAGQWLFSFLGIKESDFRIAGGILLLVLAIKDIAATRPLSGREAEGDGSIDEAIGVVPIGIPLIMGPAALTTILILAEAHGILVTSLALLANLLIVWGVFRKSHLIQRFVTKSGARAIAKVMALFLAAIGVMMIRLGFRDLYLP